MSTTNSIFTGSSRYGSDFSAVIDRAVNIASLPLAQMQSARQTMSGQSQAVSALQAPFASLKSAISGLADVAGSSAFSVTVSDNATARATLVAGATAGSYQVEVTEMGSHASALSAGAGIANPAEDNLGSSGSFSLEIYSTADPPVLLASEDSLTASTLDDLVRAINESDLDVQAALVNVKGAGSPEYKLSLQSSTLGQLEFRLKDKADPGTNLLDATSGGGLAKYTINGSAQVESDSRRVTLAPGVTLDLVAANPGKPVTVTVSRGANAFKNAARALVSAYNAALAALDQHRGQSTGALGGQSLISELGRSLRQVAGYEAGSGRFQSLAEVYIELKDNGQMYFNEAQFDKSAASRLDDIGALLGNTDSGFVKWASGILESIVKADGVLGAESASLNDGIKRQDSRIEAEQERIDRLRTDLTERMSAADAMIAALEQQVLYITGMFESMRASAKQW
jgi:flagellar hook-associated protein 2